MKLSLPVAVVLALIANLIPQFGKQAPNQAQASNSATPPAPK